MFNKDRKIEDEELEEVQEYIYLRHVIILKGKPWK